jgi:hypothetical protein
MSDEKQIDLDKEKIIKLINESKELHDELSQLVEGFDEHPSVVPLTFLKPEDIHVSGSPIQNTDTSNNGVQPEPTPDSANSIYPSTPSSVHVETHEQENNNIDKIHDTCKTIKRNMEKIVNSIEIQQPNKFKGTGKEPPMDEADIENLSEDELKAAYRETKKEITEIKKAYDALLKIEHTRRRLLKSANTLTVEEELELCNFSRDQMNVDLKIKRE